MVKLCTIEEFWKNIRGLVCVCGLWNCGSKNCKIVQYMDDEKNRKDIRVSDQKST